MLPRSTESRAVVSLFGLVLWGLFCLLVFGFGVYWMVT